MRAVSLKDISLVRKELSKVYNQYKRGDLSNDKARTSTYILCKLAELIKNNDFEDRINKLEDLINAKESN